QNTGRGGLLISHNLQLHPHSRLETLGRNNAAPVCADRHGIAVLREFDVGVEAGYPQGNLKSESRTSPDRKILARFFQAHAFGRFRWTRDHCSWGTVYCLKFRGE